LKTQINNYLNKQQPLATIYRQNFSTTKLQKKYAPATLSEKIFKRTCVRSIKDAITVRPEGMPNKIAFNEIILYKPSTKETSKITL